MQWSAGGRSAVGCSTSARPVIGSGGTAATSAALPAVARASEQRVVVTSGASKAGSIIAIDSEPTERVERLA